MKRLFIVLFFITAFSSCTTTKPLYNWGKYEESYYKYYKTQTPESYAQLYEQYANLVANPGGTRAVIPPGICAEFGYLLLAPETAIILKEYYSNPSHLSTKVRKAMSVIGLDETFAPEGMRSKGLEMLQKEIELYPESAAFLEPIIKKFNQQ
jgi:hypothetical protein